MGTQLNFSTTYHPQIDGKNERSNHILKNMLRIYVLDRPTKWDGFLHFAEFSYNNNYQMSIKMCYFEAMYGIKFHTPPSWSQPEYRLILGLDPLHEMEQIVWRIQQNIKTIQYRQKNYQAKKRTQKEFKI